MRWNKINLICSLTKHPFDSFSHVLVEMLFRLEQPIDDWVHVKQVNVKIEPTKKLPKQF